MSEDGRDDGPLGFGPADEEPARPSVPPPARDRDPDRPTAAERLAAGDASDPDLPRPGRRERRPSLPGGRGRYGWFVGVVLVLLLGLVTLNSIGSDGVSSRGLERESEAPTFAAPLALGDLDGDVNVATKADQGDAGDVPACSIRRPDVVTLCALTERRPVVLAFFATRGGDCVDQLDAVEAVSRRHPRVAFVGVSIRGDRGDLRDLIRRRGWTFPIAYDRDGVLANLYGVAVCPQIAYLRRGGRTFDTSLGTLRERDLEGYVTALERGGARFGEAPTGTTGASGATP
ncbi:redoxin domain-containing protein [Conexibacter sp. W3-3-2]|uniref:TlpA family protein disulfide reductase n=1 Tax=Conexibacter sp. W3-3-2 TaxID=2675227 RepID=UPI0012B938A1|nr:TlpA disulfide reductase family protein [Conexibacter sp. W3-3-2]MTD46862.1 redoxin domain-containing protein [Conexibacter sp. W3-3-2]